MGVVHRNLLGLGCTIKSKISQRDSSPRGKCMWVTNCTVRVNREDYSRIGAQYYVRASTFDLGRRASLAPS